VVKAIPGKKEFSGQDWAKAYYKRYYEEMGLPDKMISDRDPKFTSSF
jgi:hypothetical protein